MKLHSLLTALVMGVTLSGIQAAPGHDHAADEQPEWAELFGDASLPVVWQSALAAAERIAAAVAARKSDGVAAWAETIHLATHALIDRVELPDPGRQLRLEAALEQAARLADEVLDGAQHHEPELMAEAFRRLQSALALSRIRLPKEIAEAAPETPRFANAPAHDDGHAH